MKAEDNPQIDIYKPYVLCRSLEHVTDMTESNSEQALAIRALHKKKLNIPICGISIDEAYNDLITPNYVNPQSYIKNFLKVGDDFNDITLDYIADEEDENWLNSMNEKYKENVSLEMFENAINLLEKTNGTTKDTLLQANAYKAFLDKSDWQLLLVQKIFPELYKYWIKKRNATDKPLCRKYWPVVPGSDTNPLQVFRARDRERYKLRRAHRRNDIESFKKLQQIRKEFLQAKTILQLVSERESICESQFKTQTEIFNKRIRLIEPEKEFPKFFSEEYSPYTPQYKHVWLPSVGNILSELKSHDSEDGEAKAARLLSTNDDRSVTTNDQDKTKKKPLDKEKKLKIKDKDKKKDKLTFYTVADGVLKVVDEAPVPDSALTMVAAPLASSAIRPTLPISATPEETIYSNFSGYSKPSILESIPDPTVDKYVLDDVGDAVVISRNIYNSFLNDYDKKDPDHLIYQPYNYLQDLEPRRDEMGQIVPPSKYRSRIRIGRGGRVIVDRFPIYLSDEEDLDYPEMIYQYPTCLKIQSMTQFNTSSNPNNPKPTRNSLESDDLPMNFNAEIKQQKSGPAFLNDLPFSNKRLLTNMKKNGKNSNALNHVWASSLIAPFPLLPPMIPPQPPIISIEKSIKLSQILDQSDSEDEKVVIHKGLTTVESDRSSLYHKLTGIEVMKSKLTVSIE